MSFRTRLPRNSPRAETRCLETRSLTAHSGSGGHIKDNQGKRSERSAWRNRCGRTRSVRKCGVAHTPHFLDTPASEETQSPQQKHDHQHDQGSKWNFTILRPGGAICGISLGSPMNTISVIAIYAAISREIGLPFRFPGPESVYRALYQVTSA